MKYWITLLSVALLAGCSQSGQLYTGAEGEGEEFSASNTVGLVIGTVLAVAVAEDLFGGSGGGGGSSYVYYHGTSYDDDDWDWLPGNGQWRCRSISTGQFLTNYSCADDIKHDSWY